MIGVLRANCTVIVFFLPCGCLCSFSLPPGALGWSVIVEFPGHTHFFTLFALAHCSNTVKMGVSEHQKRWQLSFGPLFQHCKNGCK